MGRRSRTRGNKTGPDGAEQGKMANGDLQQMQKLIEDPKRSVVIVGKSSVPLLPTLHQGHLHHFHFPVPFLPS